jgi:cell division protein FtsN
VTQPRQRLSARDYKHGRRGGGFDLAQFKQFGMGLAVGLAVALLVWVRGQREEPVAPVAQQVTPPAEVAPDEEVDPTAQLEFYDMASTFEVVVAPPDQRTRRDQPAAAITTPGAYVIQAGSSRNRAGAERDRDRLGKLGIDATLQRVTIDETEWHRVIIGPLRDLSKLNETREALRLAQINFTTYRIGE